MISFEEVNKLMKSGAIKTRNVTGAYTELTDSGSATGRRMFGQRNQYWDKEENKWVTYGTVGKQKDITHSYVNANDQATKKLDKLNAKNAELKQKNVVEFKGIEQGNDIRFETNPVSGATKISADFPNNPEPVIMPRFSGNVYVAGVKKNLPGGMSTDYLKVPFDGSNLSWVDKITMGDSFEVFQISKTYGDIHVMRD